MSAGRRTDADAADLLTVIGMRTAALGPLIVKWVKKRCAGVNAVKCNVVIVAVVVVAKQCAGARQTKRRISTCHLRSRNAAGAAADGKFTTLGVAPKQGVGGVVVLQGSAHFFSPEFFFQTHTRAHTRARARHPYLARSSPSLFAILVLQIHKHGAALSHLLHAADVVCIEKKAIATALANGPRFDVVQVAFDDTAFEPLQSNAAIAL